MWITPAIGGIDYQDGKHLKRQNYTYKFIKAIVEQKKLYKSAFFLQKHKKAAANGIAAAFYFLFLSEH